MPNSETLNPLLVVNGANVTSLKRRNIFVNNTNTSGQGDQPGKEKLGVAEEPTGASPAIKIHGGVAAKIDFTHGRKQ
ncbi:hypothetical protein AHAS_Ahas08G0165100 [Arachis hypogaea]